MAKASIYSVTQQEMSDGSDLAEQVEKQERIARLRAALAALSEREREILSLKYYAELKNTEIASLTGLYQINVGVILHRTIEKLRNILKEDLR